MNHERQELRAALQGATSVPRSEHIFYPTFVLQVRKGVVPEQNDVPKEGRI
jgi:hypothetical protein